MQSIIDINGVLSFFDLTAKGVGGVQGEHLTFERKVGTCAVPVWPVLVFLFRILFLQLPWQAQCMTPSSIDT